VRDQITLLKDAGFRGAECVGNTATRTSEYTVGALFRAYRDDRKEVR
jgi:hypothetical protein